jgi:hypothetical protein
MKKTTEEATTRTETGTEPVEQQHGGVPMTLEAFGDLVGDGFEEATASAYAIPFLKVLQSMSKPCKRANPEYVEGAIEGQFFNTVSNEVFDGTDGLLFIPVHYRQKYLEWQGTLDEGGGLVAQHDVATGEQLLGQCTRDEDGNDRLPDNHILQDVREHYGVAIHPKTGQPMLVVLSLTSTQIKKSKRFMSNMGAMKRNPLQARPDASFTHVYKLTTVPEKKDQFDFYGIQIGHVCGIEKAAEMKLLTDPPAIFALAQEFREMIKSGKAEAKPDGEVPF